MLDYYEKNGVTIYPFLRLIAVKRLVFKLRFNLFTTAGLHGELLIPTLVSSLDFGISELFGSLILFIYYRFGTLPLMLGVTVNDKLRLVQRHIRRRFQERRSQRRLALLMALHPRLGAKAPISILLPDLFPQII